MQNLFILIHIYTFGVYIYWVVDFQATDADPDEHTITTVENPAAIVTAVEEPVPQPDKVVMPVRNCVFLLVQIISLSCIQIVCISI